MTGETVLLAEDDPAIRTVVTRALGRHGYRIQATSMASTLWRWIADGAGDVLVTDVGLPDENALDLLPRIRSRRADLPIIVMSAQNTLLTAVRANERGAFDYLPKPFDIGNLVATVQRALDNRKRVSSTAEPTAPGEEQLPIIGRSPAMQEIYRIIARLTNTDLTVLIAGESGTGKELVAKALHDFGKRRRGPFVAVNMAAIPHELIESELFGHEKGSFTGAAARRTGRFEQAEGGTLFLDEIGDMPLDAQTRLLRVLQQGEFLPVGGAAPIKANIRIIAASHRDLHLMVQQGMFREDLFYRLNVVPMRLPPLRERTEDIPALAQHFLGRGLSEGLPAKNISPEAMLALKEHDWPGNVRELENLIRRITVLFSEEIIDETIIRNAIRESQAQTQTVAPGADEPESLSGFVERYIERQIKAHEGEILPGIHGRMIRELEKPLITRVLEITRGNQLKAADMLGVNRNTLRKKIRQLDIRVMRSP